MKNKPSLFHQMVIESFEHFWKSYPKKRDKATARRAFEKISPINGTFEKIIQSVEAHKKTAQWQKQGGDFIPYPASFLNGEMWEDEIPVEEQCGKCNHSVVIHKTERTRHRRVTYCDVADCDCHEEEQFV